MPETQPSLLQEQNTLTVSGDLNAAYHLTLLKLADGRTIQVPTALLLKRTDQAEPTHPPTANAFETVENIVVPVIEEAFSVSKRQVETGKVTLEKLVHEYEETLDVPLATRSFEIEHIPVNRPVDAAPPVRQEGTTTIYSIVEEQLILTTQLILREELHITRRDTERRDTRTITLKRESIEVTRTPLDTTSRT